MIINKKTPLQVQAIHDATDFRTLFAGVTEVGEFKYTHGGVVKPGIEYHIHYTNDKKEVYMTGGAHTSSSKIIYKSVGTETLFGSYIRIKGRTSKPLYPTEIKVLPTPSDYRIGYFNRYFTKQINVSNSRCYEINEDQYNEQNSLFQYTEFGWTIRGDKTSVGRLNSLVLRGAEKELSGITRTLDIFQHWRPAVGSQDYLEKKLSLRRIP